MINRNLGKIDGKPITQEMLDSYTVTFERDWSPKEIRVVPVDRGITLRALQELNIPVYEIEALERRAKQNRLPLNIFIQSILRNELFSATE